MAPNRRLNAAYLTTSIMDSREISSEVWHSFGGASEQINKSQPSWDVIETLFFCQHDTRLLYWKHEVLEHSCKREKNFGNYNYYYAQFILKLCIYNRQ